MPFWALSLLVATLAAVQASSTSQSVIQVNDPVQCDEAYQKRCWEHDIAHHIQTINYVFGSKDTCHGGHLSSVIENADNNGDFKPETLKVISSDANTGLVEYRMRTIWDKTCRKTVWNDKPNYQRSGISTPIQRTYDPDEIKKMCLKAIEYCKCDNTTCETGGVLVKNNNGQLICLQAFVDQTMASNPGRSCYPRFVASFTGAEGGNC